MKERLRTLLWPINQQYWSIVSEVELLLMSTDESVDALQGGESSRSLMLRNHTSWP